MATMNIIFKYRMLSDESDNFVRDFEVYPDMTLTEFHHFLLDALGYELATEFMRDNENLENEEREELRALEIADRCEYSFGYASGVKITVKRKKDESEEKNYNDQADYPVLDAQLPF